MQHEQNNNYIRKDSNQTQRKRHYFINYMSCVLKKYVTTLNELNYYYMELSQQNNH